MAGGLGSHTAAALLGGPLLPDESSARRQTYSVFCWGEITVSVSPMLGIIGVVEVLWNEKYFNGRWIPRTVQSWGCTIKHRYPEPSVFWYVGNWKNFQKNKFRQWPTNEKFVKIKRIISLAHSKKHLDGWQEWILKKLSIKNSFTQDGWEKIPVREIVAVSVRCKQRQLQQKLYDNMQEYYNCLNLVVSGRRVKKNTYNGVIGKKCKDWDALSKRKILVYWVEKK